MRETEEQLAALQRLIDASAAVAGAQVRSIITDEHRLDARQVCAHLTGMRLLVVGTATRDGRPLVSPVDGYFIHGSFYFSSARDSLRMHHLSERPHVSATYLEETMAITVHGRAELFELSDPAHRALREEMIAHYVPIQGPDFERWLDGIDALGARIDATRMLTFHL